MKGWFSSKPSSKSTKSLRDSLVSREKRLNEEFPETFRINRSDLESSSATSTSAALLVFLWANGAQGDSTVPHIPDHLQEEYDSTLNAEVESISRQFNTRAGSLGMTDENLKARMLDDWVPRVLLTDRLMTQMNAA